MGFSDALDAFDPAEWTPKPPASKTLEVNGSGGRDAASKAAEVSGFKSREPKDPQGIAQGRAAAPAKEPVRRRRTGRNAQFNLKAKPETIEAYCAIADRMGWGLGETLEYAVTLLDRDYPEV